MTSALTSPLLSQHTILRHGYFTREGGLSCEPFGSLNASTHVGDDIHHVSENRSRIKALFNHPSLVTMQQVHKDSIYIHEDWAHTDIEIPGTDAMITHLPNVLLVCLHADCQPVFLYDTKQKVIGCVHNGWKGTVLNILGKTVSALQKRYGTDPKDLHVAIGPSLGPDHAQFKNYREELPSSFWEFRTEDDLFNFWEISTRQLMEQGVLKQNIDLLPICTVCDKRFFSYRRDRITGRNAAVIGLFQ